MAYHMNARTGWTDNHFCVFKDINEMLCRGSCIALVAADEGRLTAACLPHGIIIRNTESVEDRDHRFPGRGKHGVDKALDKEGNSFPDISILGVGRKRKNEEPAFRLHMC